MDGKKVIGIQNGRGLVKKECDAVHVSVPYSIEADVSAEAREEVESGKNYDEMSEEAQHYIDVEQGRDMMALNENKILIQAGSKEAETIKKVLIDRLKRSDKDWWQGYRGMKPEDDFPAVHIGHDGVVSVHRLPKKETVENGVTSKNYQVWIARNSADLGETIATGVAQTTATDKVAEREDSL